MSIDRLSGFQAKWINTTERADDGSVDHAASAKQSAITALKAPFASAYLTVSAIPMAVSASVSSPGLMNKLSAAGHHLFTGLVLGPAIAALGVYNLFKSVGHLAALPFSSAAVGSSRGAHVGFDKN